MSHEIQVHDTKKYYLKNELKTRVHFDDGKKYGTFKFLIDYIPSKDSDGYNPPKSFIYNGDAEWQAEEVLRKEGLNREYKIVDLYDDDVSLETVYILDQVKETITRNELKKCRYSLVQVPIKRIHQVKKQRIEKEE